MSVHRTLDGLWAECEDSGCQLKFHLPELTVEQARALPMAALLPLWEAFDPPDRTTKLARAWLQPSTHGFTEQELHRDYDLPAHIGSDGHMEWWNNGELHREHDQPAIIWDDGGREWFRQGLRHRDGGLPAIIDADGTMEWWVLGHSVTEAHRWEPEA